jgi:hypothetical protein
MLVDEFKQDYFNNMSIDDIKAKYDIGQTTYFTLLKKLGIKRRPSSKIAKILGEDYKPEKIATKISHIPIDDVYEKIDETDDKLLYSKQYVPRGTKLDIEKKVETKPKSIGKPVLEQKPVAKKEIEDQKKDDTTPQKSELLNAINRSTKVREKILNKKNNN